MENCSVTRLGVTAVTKLAALNRRPRIGAAARARLQNARDVGFSDTTRACDRNRRVSMGEEADLVDRALHIVEDIAIQGIAPPRQTCLPALGVGAAQAGHTAIHQDYSLGIALETQARTGRKRGFFSNRFVAGGSGGAICHVLATLLLDKLFLMLVQLTVYQADVLHVVFNGVADFSHD